MSDVSLLSDLKEELMSSELVWGLWEGRWCAMGESWEQWSIVRQLSEAVAGLCEMSNPVKRKHQR